MDFKDNVRIGKISEFNGYVGKIVTADKEYVFNIDDLEDDEPVEVNNMVIFNDNYDKVLPKAYYVKKLTISKTK